MSGRADRPPPRPEVRPPSLRPPGPRRGRRRAATGERRLRSSRAARPRRGTPEKTRERLVAVAAEVFNRDGYFGTDSNALARAAGYAPATFYKHFPDKRAALLAAYERWVSTEWAHIAALLRPSGSRQAKTRAVPVTRAAARRADTERAGRLARKLAAWIVAHHRRWRRLRASVLALVGTDAAVRDFYVAQRRHQLAMLRGMRARRPAKPGAREADALLLFTFERTCDAIAGGEATALGLQRRELQSLLVRALAGHLTDGAMRSPLAPSLDSRRGAGPDRSRGPARISRPSGRRGARRDRP